MAAVCRDDRADYPTYLLRLTERELLDRETRAAERRVKDARFPVTKTIDTFDFKAQPSINEPLVRELMRGEFIDKRENVLLIGNSGTGKTHLACALAFSACMLGYRVRFSTVTGLVTELLENQGRQDAPAIPQAAGTSTSLSVGRIRVRAVFQGRSRAASSR